MESEGRVRVWGFDRLRGDESGRAEYGREGKRDGDKDTRGCRQAGVQVEVKHTYQAVGSGCLSPKMAHCRLYDSQQGNVRCYPRCPPPPVLTSAPAPGAAAAPSPLTSSCPSCLASVLLHGARGCKEGGPAGCTRQGKERPRRGHSGMQPRLPPPAPLRNLAARCIPAGRTQQVQARGCPPECQRIAVHGVCVQHVVGCLQRRQDARHRLAVEVHHRALLAPQVVLQKCMGGGHMGWSELVNGARSGFAMHNITHQHRPCNTSSPVQPTLPVVISPHSTRSSFHTLPPPP